MMNVSTIQNLLQLGLDPEWANRPETVLKSGPVYERMLERIKTEATSKSSECVIETARSILVLHVLSGPPNLMATPLTFSGLPGIKQTVVLAHGLN